MFKANFGKRKLSSLIEGNSFKKTIDEKENLMQS